jgi:SNF2 family DNA or RNA helicase
MIKVLYNIDKNKVILKLFSIDNHFKEIVEILRRYNYQYNKIDRQWLGSAISFNNMKLDILEYGIEFDIHNYVQKLIDDHSVIPINVKKFRSYFDENLLKYKPLIGKHPYEDYQKDDIKLMTSYNRFVCANEQGTGKSLYISYIISNLFQLNKINKAVVLIPPDGLINLKREIIKFCRNIVEDDFFIATRFNKEIFERDYKILLCTYSTWLVLNNYFFEKSLIGKKKRVDGKLIPLEKKDIKKRRPDKMEKQIIPFNKYWGEDNKLLILDESHSISNYKSKISHYVNLYKELFEYRYEFTGTIADKWEKYYTQMNLLDSSFFPQSYNEFLNDIAFLGNKYNSMVVTKYKDEVISKMVKRIEPYIIRRKINDVLDLPPHEIVKNYIEINPLQKQIYRKVVDYALRKISEIRGEITVNSIINKFPYIIQICDNPCLIQDKFCNDTDEEQDINRLLNKWKFEDHPNFEVIDYLLNQYIKEEQRKVILWSIHPKTIDQLVDYYKKYNPLFIHGQMIDKSNEYRTDIIDKFKQNSDCHLLIASSLVVQRSVTITEATRQIMFDRSFDFTVHDQNKKRIYRHGSKEKVFSHILLIENTLHILQDAILEQKYNVTNLLNGEKYLTGSQIRDLFEGKNL